MKEDIIIPHNFTNQHLWGTNPSHDLLIGIDEPVYLNIDYNLFVNLIKTTADRIILEGISNG